MRPHRVSKARSGLHLAGAWWWLAAAVLAPVGHAQGWQLGGLDDVPEPLPAFVAGLHAAANAARAAEGHAALAWDDGLARTARQHAAELARRRMLDHTGATPATRTLADRLARAGSPYTSVGENLAFEVGARDPVATVVRGWLESPPHRHNLMLPDFDRVGYGSALDAGGGRYVVQVLAAAPWAPSSAQAALVPVPVRTVVLDVAVAPGTPGLGLLELDGATETLAWASGRNQVRRDVPGSGPLRVRMGVAQGDGRFLLDEDGEVSGRGWSAAMAPRRWLRVTGGALAERVDLRVQVRLDVPSGVAVALLVDGVHLPEASVAPGRIAVTLPLADGAALQLALAEARGGGQLLVRHVFSLARAGDAIAWRVRP